MTRTIFFRYPFKVIRKVDKQTALLDADDPVSQLHKVSNTVLLCNSFTQEVRVSFRNEIRRVIFWGREGSRRTQ